MTDPRDPPATDPDGVRPAVAPDDPDRDPHPAEQLRSTVVAYADRPNRCTICPRGIESDDLLVTWITADAADFVDLDDAR